ncbi:hypothetical protein [Qingshengfaniella alkalisoli]|uniref:Uncharacterized protein n=1 Tax=Qingshengfaniella alkalisoli TaxID=2599296 RepID=A0A5B8IUC8_9RHOB|nr:hypothetical protein [Qingshengfaniella alkalisoli]QDY69254.1 hypothetical protein FPZ52_06130 [Qingshengfaniella alkalisoli]
MAVAVVVLVVVMPIFRPDLLNVQSALQISCAVLLVAGYDLATNRQRIDPAHVIYLVIGSSVGMIAPDQVAAGTVWGVVAPIGLSIVIAFAVWALTRGVGNAAFTLLSASALALFCLIALPQNTARDISEFFVLPEGMTDEQLPVVVAGSLVGLAMLCRPRQSDSVALAAHLLGAALTSTAGLIWALWGYPVDIDTTKLAIVAAAVLCVVHLGGAVTIYGPVLLSAVVMAAVQFAPAELATLGPSQILALVGCAMAMIAMVLPRENS